jgi:hypothetical protein
MISDIIKFELHLTMSRWDNPVDDFFSEEEESRLLKKFYDYAEIEKKESERKRFLEVSDRKKPSPWGNRFVLSAIIQGAVITGLTVSLILMQAIFSDVSLIEFLSLSLDGPAKWFFFGYFMYITLVVTIAITAIFYNHLESNLGKQVRGSKNKLVWAQLIGMNVGGAVTTILLIVAGFIGTGFVSFAEGEQNQAQYITELVKIPVAVSGLVFAGGMIAGGLAYITTYLGGPKLSKLSKNENSAKYDRV